MATILLAEDEIILGKLVKEALERDGYQVSWAKDGQEAFEMYQSNPTDICVLDVMMPKVNGFELAKMIRGTGSAVPILFLTARSETNDVVKGFESGGNDYLKKPFSLEELQLRVKELLNRAPKGKTESISSNDEDYEFGIYHFSPITQTLKSEVETLKLSHKESELLRELIVHKNTLMPRKETLIKLWGDDNFFNSRTMDVYIAHLRKYLKHDPKLSIVNIRGFGFKLIVES
jgi:two-component system response regulator TrcR